MEEPKYQPLTIVFMLPTFATVYSTIELICPPIIELGSAVTFTCIGAAHAHAYSTPDGNTAASCDLRDGECIYFENFNATVLNASHSVLTILHALKTHAGAWKCVDDADSPTLTMCHVAIAKGPSCTMAGDRNTSALQVDDVITLTVNITDYFSSKLARIALVVGNIQIISISKIVTEMTNETLVTTLQLREGHFGNVTITFDSVDKNQSQICGHLVQLISKVPTCAITRRQYEDSDYNVDEEVALKVNVTGHYCSESVQFQFQTGNIQTGLNRSQWKANTDVIFNLTESHLGEVKLVFICGRYRQPLSCEGIQHLNRMNNFDDDNTGGKEEHCRSAAVIAGTVGVVVILINVLAVVICLRRHHYQKRQPPASYLGAVNVPGSAASEYGYATVDDVGYASGQCLPPTVD